jgi:cytochrome b561
VPGTMAGAVRTRYSTVAIILHWMIAAAIVAQLAGGLWMVGAIRSADRQALAFYVYQWHKSLGLAILVLTVLRLCWRLANPPPALPVAMPRIERIASRVTHGLFYVLTLGLPLVGWAMVSASPLGLPTMVFGLIELPHIGWLSGLAGGVEAAFKSAHRAMGYALIGLLALHIAAALKHHLIDGDDVLTRMLPMGRRGGRGVMPIGFRNADQ